MNKRYLWIMKDNKTFLIYDTLGQKVISAWKDMIEVIHVVKMLNIYDKYGKTILKA